MPVEMCVTDSRDNDIRYICNHLDNSALLAKWLHMYLISILYILQLNQISVNPCTCARTKNTACLISVPGCLCTACMGDSQQPSGFSSTSLDASYKLSNLFSNN